VRPAAHCLVLRATGERVEVAASEALLRGLTPVHPSDPLPIWTGPDISTPKQAFDNPAGSRGCSYPT